MDDVFATEQRAPNVVFVDVPVTTPSSDWEWWCLLRGDVHWDNPKCRRDVEKRHLDLAKERGAGILDVGDLFCLMQGKYDPRASKSDIRAEHQTGDYLDAVVRTAVDYYEPYADNFIGILDGNHNTSVLKRQETDVLGRFVEGLNERAGSDVVRLGYSGWVKFRFRRDTQRVSRNLWAIHGYGGGGPVTKDMIQSNRQLAYVRSADIMVSGHTHDSWVMQSPGLWLRDSGVVEQRTTHVVKVPTYKEEYGAGEKGWHVETGKPPKPIGCVWLRWYWARGMVQVDVVQDVEPLVSGVVGSKKTPTVK